MNLVIDDAVEVRLPTKTEAESRRELGTWDDYLPLVVAVGHETLTHAAGKKTRSDLVKRR